MRLGFGEFAPELGSQAGRWIGRSQETGMMEGDGIFDRCWQGSLFASSGILSHPPGCPWPSPSSTQCSLVTVFGEKPSGPGCTGVDEGGRGGGRNTT